MRAIDADICESYFYEHLDDNGIAAAMNAINDMPTIEPEIVRLIDADKLGEVKFHSLPYTHITPSDVEAESYKRGWNDAIDSIIDNAPTIEPERKKGKWLPENRTIDAFWVCSSCGFPSEAHAANILYNFCPNCGADMREDQHDQSK